MIAGIKNTMLLQSRQINLSVLCSSLRTNPLTQIPGQVNLDSDK